MKRVFLAVLLSCPLALFAQFPGGVNSNLRLWIKANSGLSQSSSGTVAQWNDLSGANVTGNFSTQSNTNIGMSNTQNPPAYQAAGVNFNPHVSFSQTGVNSISSNKTFVGTQMFDPYNNTVFQVIDLHSLSNTGVWFKWQYSNTDVNRWGNEVNNGGTNAGKLRFDFRGINNFSATTINDQYFLAGCNTTTSQSIIRLNGANDATMTYTTQAAFAPVTTSPARITFGNEEYGDAYPTSIDIAEIIVYNRALSTAERNKVESYLAVKYGFTLDQSAASANDYTSSNGTLIWNRMANLPFVANIAGIGRDDGDSLMQLQSKSINTTGLVTVYNGSYNGNTFPALNINNASSFQADNSYLLFGDNGGTMTLNRCFAGNPSYLRMNRSWKVQTTGPVGNVTLAVKTTDMPANTTWLLVSTDSAFTPVNTSAYRLDTMNGFLSRSLALQNNTFFTFASDSLVLRLSSNSPLCVGGTLLLKAIVPGPGVFSWTGPNNFSSTMPNPTIPAAQVANAGIYTANASINGCAFKPASITVAVSPMPAPPKVLTPLVYCKDDIAPPLTATGLNLTWYVVPTGGGSGTTVPPVPNTTTEGVLTWWVTQANNGCESIRSKQEVFVRARPNGIITATHATICQGDLDSFFYFGNGITSLQYDWKAPIGRTQAISGSGQGPVVFRFDSAGVTNIRLQVNNEGCVSPEILYPVNINPRPIANAVVQSDACVNDIVNVALNKTQPGIKSYVFDFDNGEQHYGAAPGGPYGISWSTPGTKIVGLTTISNGCPSFTSIDTILIHAAPTANITSSLPGDFCSGDSLLLEATVGDPTDTFMWSPHHYFPGNGQASDWGMVQHTGYIGLQVTSRWGCKSLDSVFITTHSCCQVSFPTAFTPNGDGRNDFFRILTQGHHEIATFRVVNRWGQTVFETREETKGWDGSFNGKPQDIGTYYYYLRFKCKEGAGHDVEEKGEFILVR